MDFSKMRKGHLIIGYKYDKKLCLADVHVIAPGLEREVQYSSASRGKDSGKLPVAEAFSNFVFKNKDELGDIKFVGFKPDDFLKVVGFSCAKLGSASVMPWEYVVGVPGKNHFLDLEELINSFTVERFKACVGKETLDEINFDASWLQLGKNAENDARFAFRLGMLLDLWG
mgnify:CR=1 FL=1